MTSAIIVAAGSSRRMGFNKLLALLGGVPVLRRTLAEFQACEAVDEIIVVAGDEVAAAIAPWQAQGGLGKLTAVIPGGAERHFSVWAGLQACSPEAEFIAVHDGARPLISPAQIAKCIAAARKHRAVACARPMTETLKRADASGRITESLDRQGVWVMETPQVFAQDLLREAYAAVLRDGALVTDEVSAVQHVGAEVKVVENTTPNPKITFPADLADAGHFLR
jgi:2-C-methyl-D-erythritol 4-phosphate cytidylyltransferase